jgi:hypothetical protein
MLAGQSNIHVERSVFYIDIYLNIYFLIYFCGPRWRSRYSDLLRAEPSGDRIPVGARFSAPVQIGPGAQPASCKWVRVCSTLLTQPGHGVVHPPLSSAEVKERVDLYLYSPSGPSWPVLG